MVSENFIGVVLQDVKAKPLNTLIPFKREMKSYPATVEAIRIIMDRRLDLVWGFELLFIPGEVIPRLPKEEDGTYDDRVLEWFCKQQRIPGRDYWPEGFKKYSL